MGAAYLKLPVFTKSFFGFKGRGLIILPICCVNRVVRGERFGAYDLVEQFSRVGLRRDVIDIRRTEGHRHSRVGLRRGVNGIRRTEG